MMLAMLQVCSVRDPGERSSPYLGCLVSLVEDRYKKQAIAHLLQSKILFLAGILQTYIYSWSQASYIAYLLEVTRSHMSKRVKT